MAAVDAATVARWVADAERVTALTGAGVSTDSAIPDSRGPRGVRTKDPAAQAMFTIDSYLADPDVRRRAWQERLRDPAWDATPGPGHRPLVGFERTGRLRAICTQNTDGLPQAAGSGPALVPELHGTLQEVVASAAGGGRRCRRPSTACVPASSIRTASRAARS